MEPTTVEILGYAGNTTFFNCGSATVTDDSTVIAIDKGHVLILPHRVTNVVDSVQRFADLLVDVTA